mmetsp:Transcript_16/g.57  ORF Transcript_16/g.57 Transcript_16/m.57 type:complete len:382 (+) Transcript_16:120-1265(+)
MCATCPHAPAACDANVRAHKPSHTAYPAMASARTDRQAIRIDPASGDGYYQLGSALRAKGPSRLTEATALLEAAAAIEPSHLAAVSTVGYMLLSASGSGAVRARLRARGLSLLARGVDDGAWPRRGQWQHPAEYLPMVPAPPAAGAHPPGSYKCILSRLEGAAEALGDEAVAALPRFSVQTEGIARPDGGWREYDVWRACGLAARGNWHADARSGAAGERPRGLSATCEALREVKRTYAFVQGAFFSALTPGTALLPHCGPTNGRLVMHIGLRVPQPGAARLRLGRPSTLHLRSDRPLLRQLGLPDGGASEIVWREGKGFVWDDSQCHEVLWHRDGQAAAGGDANGTQQDPDTDPAPPRIILLLLLLHPAMTQVPICPGER